jgi:hypothetical protein
MQEVDGSIPFSSTIFAFRRQLHATRPPDPRWRRRPGRPPVMVFVLIVLAAASRLLPHPPNFAPVAAIGLFAGATVGRRAGWLLPLAALLASDLVIGFYHPVSMFWNYLGFATCLLLGSGLLARGRSAGRLVGAVLASSVTFFALSNFGMWASGYYPRTLAGLADCYVQALPFFRNTLASDVVYSAALFGGYALLRRALPGAREAAARV